MRTPVPRVASAIIVVVSVLLSCDAPARPVAPRLAPSAPSTDVARAAARSGDPLRDFLATLSVKNPQLAETALALYDAAQKNVNAQRSACAPTRELLALSLGAYRAGGFGETGNPNLVGSMQQLVTGLGRFCAEAAPPSVPSGALSRNGALVLVRDAAGAGVETIDGLAGVSLPPGALGRDALVMIVRRIPTSPQEDVLHTDLQSGPFYDIATYPLVSRLRKPATVGLVQVGPGTAAKNVDVVIGHGTSTGTDVPTPMQSCPVPRLLTTVRVPTYLSVVHAPALLRAPIASASATTARDTSGSVGGCSGGIGGFSPFGFVTVYDPAFDARPFLSASYVCGTRFAIRNTYGGDLIAIWRALPLAGSVAPPSDPALVLVKGGGSATVDVGRTDVELRLQYGPIVLRGARMPATPTSC